MGRNLDIRGVAKSKGVFLYELAAELNISEPTLMRRLRIDLTDDEKREFCSAIDRVAAKHAAEIAATATN